jgi:hypothetical protein
VAGGYAFVLGSQVFDGWLVGGIGCPGLAVRLLLAGLSLLVEEGLLDRLRCALPGLLALVDGLLSSLADLLAVRGGLLRDLVGVPAIPSRLQTRLRPGVALLPPGLLSLLRLLSRLLILPPLQILP